MSAAAESDLQQHQQALMDGVRALFERQFDRVLSHDHRFGGDWWKAPDNRPYDALTSGGVKLEGEVYPCWCSSPEIAVQLWDRSVRAYRQGFAGCVLIWREYPRVEKQEFRSLDFTGDLRLDYVPHVLWAVYSRFRICREEDIRHVLQKIDREVVL